MGVVYSVSVVVYPAQTSGRGYVGSADDTETARTARRSAYRDRRTVSRRTKLPSWCDRTVVVAVVVHRDDIGVVIRKTHGR